MKKTILALSLVAAGALNTAHASDTVLTFLGTCDNAKCSTKGADGTLPATVKAQITLSDLEWVAQGNIYDANFTAAKDFSYQGPASFVHANNSGLQEEGVQFKSSQGSVNSITDFYIPLADGGVYFEGNSSSFALGNYFGIILPMKWKFESATQAGQWSVASVPEPESYAMFLAGLGLMGMVARRRSRQK